MDNFSFDFQRGERIESWKNGTGKSTFLNLLTELYRLMAEKFGNDAIKYYAKRNQPKPGQRVIDVIKEYGEFIPLMKGKIDFSFAIVRAFLI
jgi:ATP-binding cassette subfamily F protein uup